VILLLPTIRLQQVAIEAFEPTVVVDHRSAIKVRKFFEFVRLGLPVRTDRIQRNVQRFREVLKPERSK
jgi:hypothetical protein